jgi:hypothetical protein
VIVDRDGGEAALPGDVDGSREPREREPLVAERDEGQMDAEIHRPGPR